MTVRLEQLLAAATPGPWVAKTDGMFPVVTKNESYATVMEFSVYGRDGHVEAEANAHLVAKTPDMARLLLDMGEALARVEPELVPNHDAAQDLADKFGLGDLGRSSIVQDIRALLARLDALGKDTA